MDLELINPRQMPLPAPFTLPRFLLERNLEAYIPFDRRNPVNGDATRVYNRAPRSTAHAVLNGTATWDMFFGGPYLTLNTAGSSYVAVTGLTVDDWASGTIACYVNLPTSAATVYPFSNSIVGSGSVAIRGQTANDDWQFVKWDGADVKTASGPANSLVWGEWAMIVIDWGPLGMRLFKDGVQIGSDASTTATDSDATEDLRLNQDSATQYNSNHAGFAAWKNQQIGGIVSKALMANRSRAA